MVNSHVHLQKRIGPCSKRSMAARTKLPLIEKAMDERMRAMAASERLNACRSAIDRTDEKLARAFSERLGLMELVADAKKGAKLPLTNNGREEEVVSRYCALGKKLGANGDAEHFRRFAEAVIGISKDKQKKIL